MEGLKYIRIYFGEGHEKVIFYCHFNGILLEVAWWSAPNSSIMYPANLSLLSSGTILSVCNVPLCHCEWHLQLEWFTQNYMHDRIPNVNLKLLECSTLHHIVCSGCELMSMVYYIKCVIYQVCTTTQHIAMHEVP